MSSSPGAGYKLRPNKAVDRELFLSLLTRMSAPLQIEKYHYIGLGGAFLEDFRLIHTRVGITRMTSIDSDEQTHLRQKFNRPIESVECIYTTLEEYLDETELEDPVVLWLDFTDPKQIQSQIDLFARQVCELPNLSVLRVTLNANPSSLGTPDSSEVSLGPHSEGGLPTVQQWRLDKFKERLADYCPSDLSAEQMLQKQYGKTLLNILGLAAEKAILSRVNREIVWCLATQYSDGQFMVTVTAIVTDSKDYMEGILRDWEFHSTPNSPHVLDMPALSTLERLTLESYDNPKEKLGYDLPKSYMNLDPIETFKQFYRVFPHFTRVEF